MRLFLSCIMLLAIAIGQAQDAEIWLGAKAKYELNGQIRLGFQQEFRWVDHSDKDPWRSFTQLSTKIKINDFFGFRIGTRFTDRSLNRLRLYGDALLKYKKKGLPIRVSYRLRFQHTYKFDNEISEPEKWSCVLRNKLTVEYNLSKLVDPYVAGELFYDFSDEETYQFRLTLGADWRLTKKLNLASFLTLERPTNNGNSVSIIGARAYYNIN